MMLTISRQQNRRDFIRNSLGCAAGLTLGGLLPQALRAATEAPATKPGDQRPNIVFILADDLGYGDLGCYGATKVKTPNLDRLAKNGRRFTDGYAPAAMCTPTRYSFMTGQYYWRAKNTNVLNGDAPLNIPPGTTTVPSLLKQAGYTTGIVGKWHLGLGSTTTDYNGEIKPGPLETGFDYAFFYPATNDRVPCVFIENHRVVGYDAKDPIQVSYGKPIGDEPTGRSHPQSLNPAYKPSKQHSDTIVNGISRIGFMSGGKAARWVDEDMTDMLTGKAVKFIEDHKNGPFFLYFPTHTIHEPRVPHPRFRGSSQCGIRGDVIQELDWSVGQVLDTLDRLGLTENTLIIFSSDNGGNIGGGYDDGSSRNANGHPCNGMLSGQKFGAFEGGVRVPLIARWPGRVKTGDDAEVVCLVDLLASFGGLANIQLPDNAGPDSFNLLPVLLGEPGAKGRDHVVLNREAIRQGAWKIVPISRQPTTRPAANPAAKYHLFNLKDDIGEKNDLAAQHPDKVAELAALLEKIRMQGYSRPR